MASPLYPLRGNLPELGVHVITMEGTGAAVPTKLYGPGITLARTSEGLYTATWDENPGTFIACVPSLGADSPAAMAGFSVNHDTFATSSPWVLPFLLSEADNSIVDLADNQYLTLLVFFKQTAV